MNRPTRQTPERGSARTRLLEAARDTIRQKGFAATTVEDLCQAAGVTKGAFFHHFKTKDALGVAAAEFWAETTGVLFATAPYHDHAAPLDRVMAYLAFRKDIISGETWEYTCLVGTMAQEVHQHAPDIRDACGASILGHAETLQDDIAAAMQAHGIGDDGPGPRSLALHIQAVLQGGFILAKATGDPGIARDSIDHLKRYIECLFQRPD